MDFRDLKAGSTLYLPVFHRGALFYVGDPHGVQGDGEVSGNAIEQSLTGVFRFTVLKGKTLSGPRAENATHYFVMGIDLDLDRAMRKSVAETVDFPGEGKRPHAGEGTLALQHRDRLSHRGGRRRDAGRRRERSEVVVPLGVFYEAFALRVNSSSTRTAGDSRASRTICSPSARARSR